MFNIGPTELIVILVIALLVVGPRKLPEMAKTIGKSLREFRKAQDDLKDSFNFDVEDPDPQPPAARPASGSEISVPSAETEESATGPEQDEAESSG